MINKLILVPCHVKNIHRRDNEQIAFFLENGFLCSNTRKKLLKGSSLLFIEKVF